MIALQIEDHELDLLKELLTKYLMDLRRELTRTEKKEWRKDLEAEEALMEKLIRQMP